MNLLSDINLAACLVNWHLVQCSRTFDKQLILSSICKNVQILGSGAKPFILGNS